MASISTMILPTTLNARRHGGSKVNMLATGSCGVLLRLVTVSGTVAHKTAAMAMDDRRLLTKFAYISSSSLSC